MPDSLADYEDEIEVLSQVGQPLIVKIIAKREPPVLTSKLPEYLFEIYCFAQVDVVVIF